MKVKSVLKNVDVLGGDLSVLNSVVSGVKIDSRDVKKGDIFIALKGENFNGNDFAQQAHILGASVVISDSIEGEGVIKVKNARSAYAQISKNFYGRASDKMKIIGVTGTNGKTTTCHIIADILRFAGKKVGVIGTLGATMGDGYKDTGMTTPDPCLLHQIFKQMRDNGCEYVVMEASAHALALNKLDGITFEYGVLTNITEDHLDFFGDMESYAKAKLRLFQNGQSKNGIICDGVLDEESFSHLDKILFKKYGFSQGCDIFAEEVKSDILGNQFVCNADDEKILVNSPLLGRYNIENLLAGIAVCKGLGLTTSQIKEGAKSTLPVEGRFNVLKIGKTNVVIDFAHTPDGLEKVLTTAKELCKQKIVVIFGCGGNRDRKKRPIMGEIASRLADVVVLTSDNPRFEKPEDIIDEIREGVQGKCVCIADRKEAIEYALKNYSSGHLIIIAGKGGEKYQDIGGVKIPYNDFDVVADFFRDKISSQKIDKNDIYDENLPEIE